MNWILVEVKAIPSVIGVGFVDEFLLVEYGLIGVIRNLVIRHISGISAMLAPSATGTYAVHSATSLLATTPKNRASKTTVKPRIIATLGLGLW